MNRSDEMPSLQMINQNYAKIADGGFLSQSIGKEFLHKAEHYVIVIRDYKDLNYEYEELCYKHGNQTPVGLKSVWQIESTARDRRGSAEWNEWAKDFFSEYVEEQQKGPMGREQMIAVMNDLMAYREAILAHIEDFFQDVERTLPSVRRTLRDDPESSHWLLLSELTYMRSELAEVVEQRDLEHEIPSIND